MEELDYSRLSRLGKGASGNVFEIRHIPTGAVYALKRIPMSSDDHRREVERELAVIPSCKSPWVVNVFGSWMNGGYFEILLERCYCSLDDLLKRSQLFPRSPGHPSMPEDVILAILRQVIQGLLFLHNELRVIHRDIKPGNILVSANGTVKISDFGTARAKDAELQTLRAAQPLTFIGTHSYMSPERIRGDPYSVSSDIWSLGCVIYELCLGCPLARGDYFANLQNMDTPINIPIEGFTPALRELCVACLQFDPSARVSALGLMAAPCIQAISDEAAVLTVLTYLTNLHVEPTEAVPVQPTDGAQIFASLDAELDAD